MQYELHIPDLPVRLTPERPLTEEELLAFCRRNDILRIEQEPNGDLSIMSPTGTDSGWAELRIASQLLAWADAQGSGTAFGPNAGFRFASGAMRAADASWVSWPRYNMLTRDQKRTFAPVCPEFVIELRSPSDRLPQLQSKMREWIANGAELAWLIDPERQTVEIYQSGSGDVVVLEGVTSVAGEGPVAGFILELSPIWNPA